MLPSRFADRLTHEWQALLPARPPSGPNNSHDALHAQAAHLLLQVPSAPLDIDELMKQSSTARRQEPGQSWGSMVYAQSRQAGAANRNMLGMLQSHELNDLQPSSSSG